MLAAIAVAGPVLTACLATTRENAWGGATDATADGAVGSGEDAPGSDATTGGAGSDAGSDMPDGSAGAPDSVPVEICGEPCTTPDRCVVRLVSGQ